jgi:aerobic-type carbon monoxide dehydrogenase small subunit (CoxS/CutS family)
MELNINGKAYDIKVTDDIPLLWTLRDVIGLTGTKYGCGVGICGTCVVLMDNEPVRSCITPVSEASGHSITTIEGLSEDGTHPVQKAWMELSVTQCGYCQPGQIMSAAGLLLQNAKPTDEDIDEAMHSNICRCGTYPRIREAIHLAAKG